MSKNQTFRTEKDSLGEVKVPKKALWSSNPKSNRKFPHKWHKI